MNKSIVIASLRLGKTSVDAIKNLNKYKSGILEPFSISVVCTQVPQELCEGVYVIIWLGSDNSKGIPTEWKQGYKAFGRVKSIIRGKSYNDESTTIVDILYAFEESINRLDFLKKASEAYYDCSALPIIGLDDHSNQTIRMLQNNGERYDIGAMFYALNSMDQSFMASLLKLDKNFNQFFQYIPPSKRIVSIQKEKNTEYSSLRQIIYYGAPGTGKSHKIKEQLGDVLKENVFRTTFHPDSDYSTFVGAYKPTKGKKPLYGLNGGLTVRLNDGKDNLEEDIITYKFIPQAFLNAYIRAYQTDENVYLIIEEINRGNCAQIFGDLFQLLDRDITGKSEYTIKADADLKTFLEEKLGEDKPGIKGGELCLPSNLYIYATMNTSDQSLFPIDSAFKRRWDWEYEPIKYKNTDWVIDIDGLKYSWSNFQKEVNTRILRNTGSEDKMLGDYFVNPPAKVISYNLFRNKILFYLWNDVCKDGDADIFPTGDDFSFSRLYDEDCKQLIISVMDKLNLKPIDGDDIEDNEDDAFEDDDNKSSSIRYSINEGVSFQKTNLASELFKEYIKLYPDLSVEEVISNWKNLEGKKPKHLIEDEIGYSTFIQNSKGDRNKNERRFEKFDYKGQKVYLWKGWGDGPQGNILPFMELINKSNWGITIKRV
ncbi:AAA family ATPase [Phocaeicola plebeius]|jgi:hypothetical protein|uniref:AAA family ATPase n=1 Tax=Phocaeicola plebeius TaxID=310297 RepID=UPI000EC0A09D|nr:hypothetical protein [Bacteroides sp.]